MMIRRPAIRLLSAATLLTTNGFTVPTRISLRAGRVTFHSEAGRPASITSFQSAPGGSGLAGVTDKNVLSRIQPVSRCRSRPHLARLSAFRKGPAAVRPRWRANDHRFGRSERPNAIFRVARLLDSGFDLCARRIDEPEEFRAGGRLHVGVEENQITRHRRRIVLLASRRATTLLSPASAESPRFPLESPSPGVRPRPSVRGARKSDTWCRAAALLWERTSRSGC